MNRIQFISIAGSTVITAVTASYLLSDSFQDAYRRSNLSRWNLKQSENYLQPVSLPRPVNWFTCS